MGEYEKEKARLRANERIKLEETIKHGKWNFILIKGVLYFGGIMFLFMTLFDKFILGYEIDNSTIYFNMVIWGIGGLIFGLWCWSAMKKKYKGMKK